MAQPPINLLQGPEPVETADLHFKLLCRLKIFETKSKYEGGHSSVLAVSQYYGLIFVGNVIGFSVIQTKCLSPGVDLDDFPRKNVLLYSRPTHMSVDFSQKILVVVCNSKPSPVLIFYNIQLFTAKEVTPLKLVSLANLVPNLTGDVVDITWQPNADGILMLCMSDGSVLALSQGSNIGTVFALPSSRQATCFCWSPKGKQIVIGAANGTLSQYKPDLKLVKTIPAPPLFNGAVTVVSVLWISSYQFAVAYNDQANPESFPVITIVNANKNESVNVINYDDITYSSTLFRNHQIYMTHQATWNLIFVSSANSIETAVLHLKENSSWEQWLLGDASRAELPLNPDRQETLPLGWGFDFTSQETIPWGEGTLPPMPRLLLISDEGLLCVFNVVNAAANAPQLCTPPKESFPDDVFTTLSKITAPLVAEPPKPAQPTKSILGSAFGNLKPTYNFQMSSAFGAFTTQSQAKDASVALLKAPQAQAEEQQQQSQVPVQQPIPPVSSQPSIPAANQSIPPASTQPILPTSNQQNLPAFSQPVSFGTANTQLGNKTFSLAGNTNLLKSVPPPNLQITKFGTVTGGIFASTTTSQPVFSGSNLPQSTSASQTLAGGNSMFQTTATSQPAFGGSNLFQSTPIKQPEVTIEKVTPARKKQEEVVEPTAKTEETVSKGESPGPGTPTPVDDSVYYNALQEEIEHFNSELQQLSAKVGNLDIKLGTEEDKAKMKKSIDGLYDFWKELKDTTEAQSSEIHAVLMDLIEAFAWFEDAKSRNLQRKNPSYIELRKSEDLDPLSAKHMNEIAHLKYYIENQLVQLTSSLEKDWMDHQENYRNEVKNKMMVPPLEEVYKTMHFQLKILQKQKMLVEELKGKIALKKRKNKSHQNYIISTNHTVTSNTNGNRVLELSKLAENLLQLKIGRDDNTPEMGTKEILKSQVKAIADRSKKLTKDKQSALRDALSERDMVKIRPVKIAPESSSFIRTLHFEKNATKTPKLKTPNKSVEVKPEEMAQNQVKVKLDMGKPEPETKPSFQLSFQADKPKPKEDTSKIIISVDSSKPEEKSPLASLSGIVSSIGKKADNQTFVFGSSNFFKPEQNVITFTSGKSEQKQEVPKAPVKFTFGVSKPGEVIFGKKDASVPPTKPIFTLTSSPSALSTKTDLTKATPAPNVVISVSSTPATSGSSVFSMANFTTTPATTASTFTFTAAPNTTNLPKVNVLFGKEQQSTVFGTPVTTTVVFSTNPTTTQSFAYFFGTSTPIFGGASKTKSPVATTNTPPATTTANPPKSFITTTTPLFGTPKTTTDTPAQSSGFSFTQAVSATKPTASVATPIKPTSEAEEVDVEKVDEPVKKPETPSEKSKESPKVSVSSTTPKSSPISTKTTTETPASATPATVTVVSTPQTTAVSVKPVPSTATTSSTTTTETSTSATSGTVTSSTITTATTTASAFSLPTVIAPVVFGQTATTTTTTTTTTTSIFGTPTTTTSAFGQVSSTTPITSIFGGGSTTPATPTGSIFGGSTQAKPVEQTSTPTTASESIFGGTTPTTNAFGQPSTPTSTTAATFGQNPDSVNQTTNLFGQLLSDTNRPVFGAASSPATTGGSIFGGPKSVFGGASTTTAPLFGSTPQTFEKKNSLFGSGFTTSSSSFFGQPQTSTSFSFANTNTFNPFANKGTPTTNQSTFGSDRIFGQNIYGQSGNNSVSFGSSPNTSLFGGSSGTTSGNVFQTPTTSSTFGTATPGPFSGGASSFGEGGFGSSSSTFQKPLGGFGSPPVFWGGPAAHSFGGSPTFGGSPSFGSLPTFGSASQSTFGQTSTSTTFENLANQNTVGFGNLAQQSQSQGFGGFGSSANFDKKPSFGGTSFSGWRSS